MRTEARQRLDELFPSRFFHLMFHLQHYAQTLQSFDATFYNREPILDVTLDRGFASEFAFVSTCKGISQLSALVERIVFSDGTTAHVDDIWTLNYMPRGGIGIDDLDAVDLAESEVKAGDGGETVREMIRNIYRCASAAEEDWFVRRWLAS